MRAYQDMVFTTAARLLGNEAQAEDIAQEVFLRAYAHFGLLRNSPTSVRRWCSITSRSSLTRKSLAGSARRVASGIGGRGCGRGAVGLDGAGESTGLAL